MNDNDNSTGCFSLISILVSIVAAAISIYSLFEVKKQNRIENDYAEKNYNLNILELTWEALLNNDTQKIEKSLKLLNSIDPTYSAKIIKPFKTDSISIYFSEEIQKIDSFINDNILYKKKIQIQINSENRNFGNVFHRELINKFRIPESNVEKRFTRFIKSSPCSYKILYNSKTSKEELEILNTFLIDRFNDIFFEFVENEHINEDLILIIC